MDLIVIKETKKITNSWKSVMMFFIMLTKFLIIQIYLFSHYLKTKCI